MGRIIAQGYASSGPDSPGYGSIEEVCVATDSVSAILGVTPILQFRQQFPAFVNATRFPDAQVDMYLTVAGYMINAARWGRMAPFGVSLIAAHFLALAAQAGSNPRGIPGTIVGVLNSGSVDKVSYGRDVSSVMEENSGHWGMTTFGLEYLRFAKLFGAGPVQVGWAGGMVSDPAFYLPQSNNVYLGYAEGPAWAGPEVFQNSPNAN